MKNLKPLLLSSLFLMSWAAAGRADQMSGVDYEIIKDQLGSSGEVGLASADYSLAFAWGEPVSGNFLSEPSTYSVISGYFGGGFGNGQTFQLLSSVVGATGVKVFFQDHLQVGVPLDAPVLLTFSDQLNNLTVSNASLQAVIATDHLGHFSNGLTPVNFNFDPIN